ncbi:MAG TPA: site-2 protease family protein [Verrucomicrobiae bacterium]|jgi:Zn-dependent protease|nr:site-2 protease family protein [Verrucomicrobiae bacterium]
MMPTCKRCSREIAPGALACDACHALVHADQLDRIASRARALEGSGSLEEAHQQWQQALQLLPPASEQATWIQNHLRELEATINAPGGPDARRKWAKRLGPLGPIAFIVVKFKTFIFAIFKLKFLFSFALSALVYWNLWGWRFGLGFLMLILIHEMGHFIDVKRRGLPADMPVFLPGLGAYLRWQAMGVSLETRSAVSLAGPLAGWMGAAVCGLLWWQTGNGIWAALGYVGASFNALNLIPVSPLDGGHAFNALSRAERALVLLVAVVLGLGFGKWIFYGVAAGAAWRLFTKDDPEHSSPMTTAYFLIVLTLLGLTMWLLPGQGLGLR